MQTARQKGLKRYSEKRKGKLLDQLKAGTLKKRNIDPPSKNAPKRILKRLQPRKPIKRRNALHPLSKKRAAQNREYLKLRTQFLENHRVCAVYPDLKSQDVHHQKGRRGYADLWARESNIPLLLDVRYFLAVSRLGHIFIENNPSIAYEKGWSLKRLATT